MRVARTAIGSSLTDELGTRSEVAALQREFEATAVRVILAGLDKPQERYVESLEHWDPGCAPAESSGALGWCRGLVFTDDH